MRLDLRAAAGEKVLPAGTYNVGNDGAVGTLDSKSVISQSIRMVSLPVNLNQVRWKSPNPVKYIPLR